MSQDDTAAALRVAQEGVEKFRQKGDKQAEAQALDLLAGVHLAANEKDEASCMSHRCYGLCLVNENRKIYSIEYRVYMEG